MSSEKGETGRLRGYVYSNICHWDWERKEYSNCFQRYLCWKASCMWKQNKKSIKNVWRKDNGRQLDKGKGAILQRHVFSIEGKKACWRNSQFKSEPSHVPIWIKCWIRVMCNLPKKSHVTSYGLGMDASWRERLVKNKNKIFFFCRRRCRVHD